MSAIKISNRFIFEAVGQEALALNHEEGTVVRLSRAEYRAVRDIQADGKTEASGSSLSRLTSLGIVEHYGPSRRSAVIAGFTAAGVGAAVLALPSVATATSLVDLGPIGRFALTQYSLAKSDWPEMPSGTPGPLVVEGVEYVFSNLSTPSQLLWGPPEAPQETATGSFVLNGLTYTVTFVYGVPG